MKAVPCFGPTARVRFDPDKSVVMFDNGPYCRKAQASTFAFTLGREKGFEYLHEYVNWESRCPCPGPQRQGIVRSLRLLSRRSISGPTTWFDAVIERIPPLGIESRALTHRFINTCWNCVASPATAQRSLGS